MLRLLEVCAGIGGISLGFEMTGHFQTVGFVEIDTYAQKILNKHWPDVPCYRDVRSVSAWTLPTADVLAGGIPCQPHSLAGKRGGADDERDLWPEFFRLVCEIQPAYAVVENVPGLRSSDGGRFFGTILRDLAQAGYDAEWVSFPASALGAWHHRERVWIVAYPKRKRYERTAAANQSTHNQKWHCSTHREIWQTERGSVVSGHQDVQHSASSRLQGANGGELESRDITRSDWWATEPDVGRVAHGVPHRVDKLRCLGNAVVPQCAAVIAEYIWRHWQAITR